MSAEPSRRHKYLLLTLLFFAAVVALSQGIWEVTGVTAKDEYHLVLRTPLFMMEHDEWVVPRLDGIPREKPPMISWLTRASFEIFGVSLTSARMINVLFAALLVLVTSLIGLELTQSLQYSLVAGLIALSAAGMAIQSKFLLYDIPTATCSAFAFYWFLKWCRTLRTAYLIGVAASLSAGFLTKGPIGFVIFGSGVLALSITNREVRSVIWQRKGTLMGSLFLFLGLGAPWFVYVYAFYPTQSMSILQREIAGRNIGDLTVMPIIGAALIAFPWTFVLIDLVVRPKSLPSLPGIGTHRTMFLLWFGLSILPFFFIKTFIRYLIGSIIPIALLCASVIESDNKRPVQFHARLGMIITSFFVLCFAGFAWWFKTSIIEVIAVLVAWSVFAVVWWRGAHYASMALSATFLWMTVVGFLYPTLGVNAIPAQIVKEVEGRPIILYGDQQPALLPITMGRSLRVTPVLRRTDFSNESGRPPLIFAKEEDAANLEHDVKVLGFDLERVDSYRTLSSRVSWVRFTRRGATWSDWVLAAQNRSLDPVKLTIALYGVKLHGGPEPESAVK